MQTMREDSLKRKSEVNLKMNFAASRFERCSRRRARIRMLRARRTSTPAVNHESLCEPRIALAPQSIARARDSRWPETALAPLQRFTIWFFDVDKHPLEAVGIVTGALVMHGCSTLYTSE